MAQGKIYTGDSAIVEADIFVDEGLEVTANNVTWAFADPTGNQFIFSVLPSPTNNQFVMLSQDNGGFNAWSVVQWNGVEWYKLSEGSSALEEGTATLIIPGDLTGLPGLYKGLVRFNIDGILKSQPVNFEVTDPFEVTDAISTDPEQQVVDRAWMKFSDLFDSELGGPWLRDKTLTSFNKQKLERLMPDALYGINNTMQPTTTYDTTSFPFAQHGPLLTQALFVEGIYHIMRSYVEQYQVVGSQANYFDRRDYLQRWQLILQQEEKKLVEWVDLFKREMFGFGQVSTLLGGYSGFYARHPRYMRGRYPYIFRYY